MEKIVSQNIVILLLLLIVITVSVWKLSSKYSKTTENFENKIKQKNNVYLKYPETYVDEDTGLEKDKLYKDYQGPLKNKKVWENMNLDQCQDACNNMKECVGFSRKFMDDNEETECYPRTNVSRCHSSRKGDAKQRFESSNYQTFIKKGTANQMRCLGNKDLTLNRLVCIKSMAHPMHYMAVENNTITLKKFEFKGTKFINQCQFKVVPGLEGSGTVSFIVNMTDKTDKTYYLTDNNHGHLGITDNVSNVRSRSKASFELIDGLANNHMVSLLTFSATNVSPGKIVKVANTASKNPKLVMVPRNKATKTNNGKDRKMMTFDIVDTVNNSTIISKFSDVRENCCGDADEYPPKMFKNIIKGGYRKEKFNDTELNAEEQKELSDLLQKCKRYDLDCDTNITTENELEELRENVNEGIRKHISEKIEYKKDDVIKGSLDADYTTFYNTNEELVDKNNILNELQKAVFDKNKKIYQLQKNNLDSGEKIIEDVDRLNMSNLASDYYFLTNLAGGKFD